MEGVRMSKHRKGTHQADKTAQSATRAACECPQRRQEARKYFGQDREGGNMFPCPGHQPKAYTKFGARHRKELEES